MPAGGDVLRDERRRLANVIASAALWTEVRLRDGSRDGNALARTDERVVLAEADYTEALEEAEVDVHRKFQVRTVSVQRIGDGGGSYSNVVQDLRVTYRIVIAHDFRGGDLINGDWAQLEEVAIQDAEAVRQKIEHPANRTAGGATGVTTGNTVRVHWLETQFRADRGRARLLTEMHITSDLRVTTEAA